MRVDDEGADRMALVKLRLYFHVIQLVDSGKVTDLDTLNLGGFVPWMAPGMTAGMTMSDEAMSPNWRMLWVTWNGYVVCFLGDFDNGCLLERHVGRYQARHRGRVCVRLSGIVQSMQVPYLLAPLMKATPCMRRCGIGV